jgi:hypothetical protein
MLNTTQRWYLLRIWFGTFFFYLCSELLNSRSSASLSGAFGGVLRTSTTSTVPHDLLCQVFLPLEFLICTEWVGWLAGAGFSYLKECQPSAGASWLRVSCRLASQLQNSSRKKKGPLLVGAIHRTSSRIR